MSLSDYKRYHVGVCAVCARAPREALDQIRDARASEARGYRPGAVTIMAFLDGDYNLRFKETEVEYHIRRCL